MITRYSRPEMRAIWTDENKLRIWLQIELLASEALAAKGPNAQRFAAGQMLAVLAEGKTLPAHFSAPVAVWQFGNDLTLVALPGEVVVDYSLRLKREFDASRLWINAYANDVPCYIPSRRIWREGGYEGGYAMIYFDRPTRFAENIEDLIIATVHELLPKEFLLGAKN